MIEVDPSESADTANDTAKTTEQSSNSVNKYREDDVCIVCNT